MEPEEILFKKAIDTVYSLIIRKCSIIYSVLFAEEGIISLCEIYVFVVEVILQKFCSFNECIVQARKVGRN
jgi:hypothetical protein